MILECPTCEKKLKISSRTKAKTGRCSCGTVIALFPIMDTHLMRKAPKKTPTRIPRRALSKQRSEEETPTEVIAPAMSVPAGARRVPPPRKRPILKKAPSIFPSPQDPPRVETTVLMRKSAPVARKRPVLARAPSDFPIAVE